MPNGFPFHHRPVEDRPNSQGIFSKKSIQRLDFLGTALLLITCIFFVAALEQGGVAYPWKSAFVCQLELPTTYCVYLARIFTDIIFTSGNHFAGHSRSVCNRFRALGASHYSQSPCDSGAGLPMAICAKSGLYGCSAVSYRVLSDWCTTWLSAIVAKYSQLFDLPRRTMDLRNVPAPTAPSSSERPDSHRSRRPLHPIQPGRTLRVSHHGGHGQVGQDAPRVHDPLRSRAPGHWIRLALHSAHHARRDASPVWVPSHRRFRVWYQYFYAGPHHPFLCSGTGQRYGNAHAFNSTSSILRIITCPKTRKLTPNFTQLWRWDR